MLEIVLAANMALQPAEVRRTVLTVDGAPADVVACRLVNPQDSEAHQRLQRSGLSFEWLCKSGDRLQCDAPSLEPVDLDEHACVGPRASVRFVKSRMMDILAMADSTVEWRAEGGSGTRLIATREVASEASLAVSVGGRAVRIKRAGYSPVTSFVSPGARLRVERPAPGGELLGRIGRKAVYPQRIVVEGPRQVELPIDEAGRFGRSGLPPGQYRVTTLYVGGIRGDARDVDVLPGETSEVYGLAADSVGGVQLQVAPAVCDAASAIVVNAVAVSQASRATSIDRVTRRSLAEACDWRFEGLRPGRYEAQVQDSERGDLRAVQDFTVTADRLAWAHVGEPTVWVDGFVMQGDKPAAGVIVAFDQNEGSRRTWLAVTDQNGGYHLALSRPGMYAVDARAARHMGSSRTRLTELLLGANRFDLRLPASRLLVKVRRSDQQPLEEGVSIHLRGPIPNRTGFALPGESRDLDFVGLPLGRYTVTADTPSGLSALHAVDVLLSEASPEASVTLTLAPQDGELRLVWGDGSPVQGARVQVHARILDETVAGIYKLVIAAPGTQLLISAPGGVPVCHILGEAERGGTTLPIQRGHHAVEISLSPPLRSPTGQIIGLPGSTCPVPVGITSYGMSGNEATTLLRIQGLPEGQFWFQPPFNASTQVLDVPGPGLKITRPGSQPKLEQ